ncbi:MAG: phosphohydrolase [Clostridiales bacterium GWF2_36_10]|nr:MAG: phosphohydrolase [Clostridiales bacterium GWF2_36_10]HAN21987.1 phosphohydrolase [Clostridiales bacterium]
MKIKDLYNDINNHLLNDQKPSIFLNEIYNNPLFLQYPFKMLYDLKKAEQSPQHHPEGNVWNHTMLVVDEAASQKVKSNNQSVFMWAALLHDIGKPSTTRIRKGKITSYDHDKIGADLAKDFLLQFTDNDDFIKEVSTLIRYHMQILFVVNDLPFADINGMKINTDINEVALLGLCDRLGRTNSDIARERENIRIFLQKCN